MLPSLIATTPTRPEIGAVTVYQPERDLQIADRGGVADDGRARCRGGRLGVVEVQHRGGGARDEVGVARHVALRLFELRLVLGELRLRHRELRLRLPVVEREQRVARLHLGAVGDLHLHDGGVEVRPQGDARDRLRRADLGDGERHGFPLGPRDPDRNRRAGGRRGRGYDGGLFAGDRRRQVAVDGFGVGRGGRRVRARPRRDERWRRRRPGRRQTARSLTS